MNAIDFVKNFNSNNISAIITNFFDEIMVLYNLVGSRQNICIDSDDASIARFIIQADSDEEATKIYNSLNCSEFVVYDTIFKISMDLNGNSVSTVINKK